MQSILLTRPMGWNYVVQPTCTSKHEVQVQLRPPKHAKRRTSIPASHLPINSAPTCGPCMSASRSSGSFCVLMPRLDHCSVPSGSHCGAEEAEWRAPPRPGLPDPSPVLLRDAVAFSQMPAGRGVGARRMLTPRYDGGCSWTATAVQALKATVRQP